MERLATLDFVHKAQNLFITGSSGTGKSYLACALGHEACKRGFRTFYANAPKLLGALKVAKVKGTLEAELKKIERCQLLILDDLFIVPLDAKERPILLEIIEDRDERKSVIITSQYPSSNWYDMVGDPTIADAILDRIIHTAHTIELYGESMRKLKSKKNGLSGNFWLVSFKISYLCLPLFYEPRTTPSCHPSGCAYRQL